MANTVEAVEEICAECGEGLAYVLRFGSAPDEPHWLHAHGVSDGHRGHPAPRCSECAQPIEPGDVRAGYGMCGGCLHDALRSGWEPGE